MADREQPGSGEAAAAWLTGVGGLAMVVAPFLPWVTLPNPFEALTRFGLTLNLRQLLEATGSPSSLWIAPVIAGVVIIVGVLGAWTWTELTYPVALVGLAFAIPGGIYGFYLLRSKGQLHSLQFVGVGAYAGLLSIALLLAGSIVGIYTAENAAADQASGELA